MQTIKKWKKYIDFSTLIFNFIIISSIYISPPSVNTPKL